jgi:hypothetical protein
MACGCKKTAPPDTRLLRARALMCGLCPHRVGAMDEPDVRCGLNKQPLVLTVKGMATCPIGRHPDQKTGMVEWLGQEWMGVPFPLKLAVRLRVMRWAWGVGKLTGPVHGCGCHAEVKRLTAPYRAAFWRAWSKIRRAVGENRP